MPVSADKLIYSTESIDPETSVENVLKKFNQPVVKYLVVISESRLPIGFISKERLSSLLARKYGYALYQNKPASAVMEPLFLQMDVQSGIHDIVTAAVSRDHDRVYDDIVMIQDGRYQGLVSIQNLIVAQMNHIVKQNQTLNHQDQSLRETQFRFESSEIKYRYLFDYSLNALAVVDERGVIIRCNRRFEKLIRMPAQEIEGRLSFISLIHADDRAELSRMFLTIQKNHLSVLENGIHDDVREIRFVTKDNESRIADFAAHYWPHLQHMIVSLHDITERKIYEVKFRQSEKLSAIGTLLAGITHELNNQLTPILAYVDLILSGSPVCDDKTKQRLELIKKSASSAASIVGSLLRYSRPKQLNLKYSDINRLIRDSLQLIIYHAQYKNSDIRLELADPLPDCRIDENQIGQVLLNLFINAFQAMEGKSGKLVIRTWRDGLNVAVEISDNGTGMPPEITGKIFEPFFTTKDPGKGTGLGLSISYSIIKSHGGDIDVKSEPGQGSVFTIRLPVYSQHENAEPGRDEKATAAGQSISCPKKIMIVEDDPVVSRLTKEIMSEYFSCDIRLAENGRHAVELLQTDNHYDLILSDIRMPVMDGIDFHKWIRESRRDLMDKFIFITGDTYDKRVQDYVNEQDVNVLHKPFSIDQIMEKVKEKKIFGIS